MPVNVRKTCHRKVKPATVWIDPAAPVLTMGTWVCNHCVRSLMAHKECCAAVGGLMLQRTLELDWHLGGLLLLVRRRGRVRVRKRGAVEKMPSFSPKNA
mmetsp:Transcript_99955/g.320599  ORF Transcript_99955/g.320599 Transcript_99955/m.320599 type:complete len:99 (+) Transcript_99955:203-499(+)